MRSRPAAPGLLAVLLGVLAARAAPVRAAEPYDLTAGREVPLLAAGGSLAVASFLVWRAQDAPDSADVARLALADLPAVDRVATRRWSPPASRTSDWLEGGIVAAPLALIATGELGSKPATPLVMYAETRLVCDSLVQLLKGLVTRARPYARNRDPGIPAQKRFGRDAARSFPSGHAAGAFLSAVFMGTVYARNHPDSDSRAWVWSAGLAGAASITWLRVEAGRHYPTDVLAGAAVGALAGWAIPALHRGTGEDASPAAGPGVAFSLRF